MQDVLPTFLTPERMIKVALIATSRDPKLLDCNPQSVLRCIMTAAELGLEPGGPFGHFYLIPFKGVCTPIVGYQGLIELVHRSGRLLSISAHVVHENDPHKVKFGKRLILWHSPCLTGDPGAPLFAYAVAELKGGGVQAAVMTIEEINRIKQRSAAVKAGRPTPWDTDEEEMQKKTVLRRLCKLLPKSADDKLARAFEVEDEEDGFVAPSFLSALPSTLEPAAPAPTRTQAVKAQVAAAARKGVVVQRADLGQTEEDALAGNPPPDDYDLSNPPFDRETGEIAEPGAAG
jgi:phage RecT family recombinase